MQFPKVGKSRRPKFELHLKIYELNNVPLISGNSYIKWHLAHSMYAEHRGRTNKCPISNHRVDYNFSCVIPSIRISLDKNSTLQDCPFELEVLQEFAHAEKTTLGHVKLNLSEYVQESEPSVTSPGSGSRRRSTGTASINSLSPTHSAETSGRDAQKGIIRRFLMQDSKINSTLKLGILMVQLDGDRSFVAPPLRAAPVFGSIAGFITPDQMEDEAGPVPSFSKSHDNTEVQDLYRRTLAASWAKQRDQPSADECIENIFSGGDGWNAPSRSNHHHDPSPSASTGGPDAYDDDDNGGNTLRPSDLRRLVGISSHRRRPPSASSDKSVSTVTGSGAGHHNHHHHRKYLGLGSQAKPAHHTRTGSRTDNEGDGDGDGDDPVAVRAGRSESVNSLAPTLGSSSSGTDRGRREPGYKHQREVGEDELRDDFVAWSLPRREGFVA